MRAVINPPEKAPASKITARMTPKTMVPAFIYCPILLIGSDDDDQGSLGLPVINPTKPFSTKSI
jgi:hypothetical protein